LQEEPWTSYGAQNWILTQEMTEYSFTFTMPVTDSAVGFNFHMGAPNSGDIFIDDVGLYDMDPQTPVSDNMLQNGDFSNGTEAWDLYANDPGIASMSVVNGELVVDISNAADGMWDIGVLQAGLHIKNSGRYTFSFKARAESVKTIWTSIQKPVDPWTGYSDLEVINLTTDMQQYTFDFTMLNITDDTAQIVFHIGADDIDLYLDDVTLYKVASPAVSMPTPLFRGINLSNTFDAPYEGAWGEGALMQEAYFQVIKDADFDHIRIPVRWSAHAEETAPYTIDPEFFDRIDWAIDNTISRGMTAVIDMHHYEEFNADPESQRERFIALWGQIAEHYKGYPDNLYFELYNEPGLSALFTVEFWNDAVKDVYNLIRTTNPTRYIVIGTVQWKDEREGSVQLELPDNYTNIILTFHPYIPWDFCFQQVEWMENPPPASEWNGTLEQREHIIEFLNIYTQWRAVHSDVPLWNGEFCVHMADMDSRVRWNTFISRECEKRGIAHTYWGFMNDEPALYDTTAGEWEKVDILHALLPEE
ncbi:MAG: cellulase family glycosylhydrolase, partial [Spirochaetales bacterium]|nr:cellulase family glycosylhydrolase [Spirochaetales bacterium]